MGKFPDHRLDLGALVLQGEIAVAGGVRPAEAGDFAAYPDMAVGVLYRPLQRGGQFGNGEFGRVDQGFKGGHFGQSIRRLWGQGHKVGILAAIANQRLHGRLLCIIEFSKNDEP